MWTPLLGPKLLLLTGASEEADPKGRVSENRVHFSLAWPFGSLTRPAGSVLTDAVIREESIGWIPKVQVHFSRPRL